MGHLYSAIQGFGFGAIVMAFVAGYNTSQLPLALICLIASVVFRLTDK